MPEHPMVGIYQSATQQELLALRTEMCLTRFEFFECLIRIAGQKYRFSGQNPMGTYQTYADALERLLQDIFSLQDYAKSP